MANPAFTDSDAGGSAPFPEIDVSTYNIPGAKCREPDEEPLIASLSGVSGSLDVFDKEDPCRARQKPVGDGSRISAGGEWIFYVCGPRGIGVDGVAALIVEQDSSRLRPQGALKPFRV